MTCTLDHDETAPATGLSSTPGDYRFPPGTLAGRYVLGERLGGGGMGVVYAAHDLRLDRKVALKLLRPDAGASGQARDELVCEARTLARLTHPNVVTVHDIGEFDGRFYVEMELVKGATLAGFLRAKKRSWTEVLEVFVQAGRGLAAAHAMDIVHRDFKPDNVLVGDDGRVRVADFGIALLDGDEESTRSVRLVPNDSPSRSGAGSGTPGYMSPEQRTGGRADARSDQFSFCVALYEALHGARPRCASARRRERAEEDLQPPHWLDEALRRGLAMNPDDRYPSMTHLLDVLAMVPRRRQAQRRALVAVAAGALLLLAGERWGGARAHVGEKIAVLSCDESTTKCASDRGPLPHVPQVTVRRSRQRPSRTH